MKSKVKSFLLAWFIAALTAAITYVSGAGGISGPYEIMIAIAMETILAAIVVPVVALPLVMIFKRHHIAVYWVMIIFVLSGATVGAFVFDYFAGGSMRWLILGGSIPGSVSGLTFFTIMHLAKQFRSTSSLGS